MNELFSHTIVICGGVSTIVTTVVLLVKPLRERVLGIKQIRDGQRCLLRSDMMHTYYKNRAKDTIRQYEKENFMLEYAAYKALGGNSFIDDICKEIRTWEVIT